MLNNIRGISSKSLVIPRNSAYPPSCGWLCSKRSGRIATTYDRTTDTCALHDADENGTPCITLTAKMGSAFSMTKLPGTVCPKVRPMDLCCVCVVFKILWKLSSYITTLATKYIIPVSVICSRLLYEQEISKPKTDGNCCAKRDLTHHKNERTAHAVLTYNTYLTTELLQFQLFDPDFI